MLTYGDMSVAVGVKYRHQAQLQDHLAVEEALARRACVVRDFACFAGALLVQKCKH